MVELLQVEDLDRLNIIHVTGTKGKVGGWVVLWGIGGLRGGCWCPWLHLPLLWNRGFNNAVSSGLSVCLH